MGNGHTIYNAELEVRDRARLTLGREDGSDSPDAEGLYSRSVRILVIDSGTLNMYSDVKLTGHMASSKPFLAVQCGFSAAQFFNMYGDRNSQ